MFQIKLVFKEKNVKNGKCYIIMLNKLSKMLSQKIVCINLCTLSYRCNN